MALPPYLQEVGGEEDPPELGAEEEQIPPAHPKVKWIIPNPAKWAAAIIAALIGVAYWAIADRIGDVKTDATNASNRMERRIGDVETKLDGRIRETHQDLREDIRDARTDLRGEIGGVRQDIQGLRDDVQGLRQDRRSLSGTER